MIIECGCGGFPAPGVVCGFVQEGKKCLAPDDYICRFKTTNAPEPDLKGFCNRVLEATHDGCAVESYHIQEWGIEFKLLEAVEVSEPCSDTYCQCADYDNIPGTCYRPVDFLAEVPSGK